MNYIDKKKDPSLIIKRYFKEDEVYIVEYLDGEITEYSCFGENYEEKLKEKMLEQALDRENSENIKEIEFKTKSSLIIATLSTVASLAILSSEAFSALILIMGMVFLYKGVSLSNKLMELKKYKLFFELLPHLDTINKSEFLKCIEFDNFYQIPLDINTLDEYSYSDVKTLYKKFKSEKNNRF